MCAILPLPPNEPLSVHNAATIDRVSELRGDVLINLDTLGIDLTSCCNDLLVFVKDHCLSGPWLVRRACLIVMETIITAELGQSSFGVVGSLPSAVCHTSKHISISICLGGGAAADARAAVVRGQRQTRRPVSISLTSALWKSLRTGWVEGEFPRRRSLTALRAKLF